MCTVLATVLQKGHCGAGNSIEEGNQHLLNEESRVPSLQLGEGDPLLLQVLADRWPTGALVQLLKKMEVPSPTRSGQFTTDK